MFDPDKIKQILEERGIKQSTFLKDINMSKSNLYAWMNGSSIPRVDSIEAIADYFDVPIDYFFERKFGQKEQNLGHQVNGNGNTVSGDITLNECKTENAHLKELLEEKERTIQILLKKNNL